jgi:hypothetical protein
MFDPAKMLFNGAGLVMALALSIGQTTISAAGSDKVPTEVSEKAQRDGAALVLVGLKVPWQLENALTDTAVQTQRQAIHAVQNDLLVELTGTKHTVIRQYDDIPGIALEVTSDALAVLEKSPRVTNVLLDRPTIASLKPRAPGMTPAALPASLGRATQDDKVPTEIFEAVKNGNLTLVLVGLKSPWLPEGPLSEALVAAQRNAIAASQQYLLIELQGTKYRVMRLYRRIPGIALQVGSDALSVLAKSPAVTNVLPDRVARPKR